MFCELSYPAYLVQRDLALVTSAITCTAIGAGEPGPGMLRHVAWLNTLTTPEAIRAGRFIDAPVAHPAVTFRRDAIDAIGGYRDGDFPEDHDLWLRLLEANHRFGQTPGTLTDWRDRPTRLTRTAAPYRDAARRAHVHRFLVRGPLADRRARIWGAGPFGKRHAKGLTAQGATLDDVIDIDPKKIGRRVAGGLPVVHADTVGPPDGRLVLLAVGSRGARQKIIDHLEARGHRPERDYLPLQ